MVDMRLILIRHGQTSSNIGHHLDTREPGANLTDLGHEQAQALPAVLEGTTIEAIYASTLLRTQQTAAPLAAALGLEVNVRAGLREISAGTLEMANDDASIEAYLSVALGWAEGSENALIPGTGEDGSAVLGRFDDVVAEVVASGVASAVLVTHGAMIRACTGARCKNLQKGFTALNSVSNTGVVVVEGTPGSWRVVRWQEQALGES
ncbi:histidine phosphatase family protein [Arthrobacter psychrolactophilus]